MEQRHLICSQEWNHIAKSTMLQVWENRSRRRVLARTFRGEVVGIFCGNKDSRRRVSTADGRIVWCDMQTDGNPPLYDAAALHDRDSKYSKGFIDGGGWMLAVHIKEAISTTETPGLWGNHHPAK